MSQDNTNHKSQTSFRDLQSAIDSARDKRDDLNQKTKDYIDKLQELESKIENVITLAKKKYKKKRDHWNNKVAKLKDKKIEYKNLLHDIIGEKRNLEQEIKQNKGQFIPTKKIDNKIDGLERRIETENLSLAEENAIIDQISELAKQKNDQFDGDKSQDLLKKEKQIEIVKINLNKIYEQLEKWSNKSQDYHNKMLAAYDKANELKDKKKEIEEKLIENKKKADKFHEKYLNLMKQRKSRNRGRSYKQKNYSRRKKKNDKLEKIKQDKLATALEKQKAGKKLNIYEARLILEDRK
ncbi:MAG: DUF7121 family protein [Promethearchaeati archaeon]